MSLGWPIMGVSQKKKAGGAPFPAGSADNGLSVDPVSGRIVWGNQVAEVGSPAQLLDDREILLNNHRFFLTQGSIAINLLDTNLGFFFETGIVYLRSMTSGPASGSLTIGDSNGVFVGVIPPP